MMSNTITSQESNFLEVGMKQVREASRESKLVA
jgi:hypothetical protein